MKKALALITSVVMSLALLSACGGAASSSKAETASSTAAESTSTAASTAESTAAPAGEKFKVYLITMDQTDQHWVNVDKGAQEAAAALGNVEYKWFAPDVKDDVKQIEQINNAVADGANAIMIAANGPTAVTSALEEASNAGVKIVYVDSPADFPAYATIATNNTEAGKTAGEELKKVLAEKNITSGKIGIIGVAAATVSTVSREEGFREAFKDTEFELLETQYGEGDVAKSKDIAANYIAQGVVGLFGTNEGSTVGAGNAIMESGGEVLGIGFDKSDAILDLIKNGYLVAAMAQNPDVMGRMGMETAVAALKGEIEATGEVIDTGVSVITKDTL